MNPAGNVANLVHFKPGQSGNPGGKPKGARDRLTGAFLRDFIEHYEREGKSAFGALLEKDPGKYLTIIASLIPRQPESQTTELGYADIVSVIGFLRSFLDSKTATGTTGINEPDSDVSTLPQTA